jgi:hypothetical protein
MIFDQTHEVDTCELEVEFTRVNTIDVASGRRVLSKAG